MDNQNKKTTRKTHDINSHIEEENLWDLEDDWDNADDEASEKTADVPVEATDDASANTSDEEVVEAYEENEPKAEVAEEEESDELNPEPLTEDIDAEGDEFELEAEEKEANLEQVTLDLPEEITDVSDTDNSYAELDEKIDETPEPDAPLEDELETDAIESDVGSELEPVSESSDIEKLAAPLKKWGLSGSEKIALAAIAVAFVGLTIWGIVWLKQKNNQSMAADNLELPVKGQQAIVTEFTTFWKAAGKAPGIKLGAAIVPAASITLDDKSSSGALRVYFKNAKGDRVGDTITVSFTDGKFENDTNTVEVAASDGFHLKGDFHAYQMDNSLAWTITVLEASDRSAKSSDFTPFIETKMSPAMR